MAEAKLIAKLESREGSMIFLTDQGHPRKVLKVDVAGEFQLEQGEGTDRVQQKVKPELKCLGDGWREKVETILIWSEPPHKMFYTFTVLSLIYSLIFINITLWAFIIALSMLRYMNCQEPSSPF